MSPYQQPKNPDGSYNIRLSTSVFNTLYLAEENIQQNDGTRAISNTSVTYRITDDLKFRTRYAIDFLLGVSHEFRNPDHGDGASRGGYSFQNTSRNFTWFNTNSLDYVKTFGNDHNIAATLQTSFGRSKNTSNSSSGENVAAEGLFYVNSFQTNQAAGGGFSDWRELSFLGLLNYSYKDKYIADFSFKRDGSSRFASGNRFGLGGGIRLRKIDPDAGDFGSGTGARGQYHRRWSARLYRDKAEPCRAPQDAGGFSGPLRQLQPAPSGRAGDHRTVSPARKAAHRPRRADRRGAESRRSFPG